MRMIVLSLHLLLLIFSMNQIISATEPVYQLSLNWKLLDSQSGLSSNQINAIIDFQEKVYIGTDKGLDFFDPKTEQLVVNQEEHNILALNSFQAKLWVGTARGLAIWENNKLKFIKNRKLKKMAINVITHKDGMIYLGTNKGLWMYDPESGKAEKFKKLDDQSIRVLKFLEQGLLISVDKNQGNIIKPKMQNFETIKVELNTSHSQIMDICALGDYIWFATDGNGLIGYNIMSYQWFSSQNISSVDAFANILQPDGHYLWYGAFSGLFRYDVVAKTWSVFSQPVMQVHGISTLGIQDNTIWVGTNGGGVLYSAKQSPCLQVSVPERYFSNEVARIEGTICGATGLVGKINYRALSSLDKWKSENTSFSIQGKKMIAEIDFNFLQEHMYEFRITVQDQQGLTNESRFTLVKETHGVNLTPKPKTLKTGRSHIQGKFTNPEIAKIILNPGNNQADLNRSKQTFSGEVILSLLDKRIEVTMFDEGGDKKQVYYPIKVKSAPEINIVPLSSTFTPGLSEVVFNISCQKINTVDTWRLKITSPEDELVREYSDKNVPPSKVSWDGKNSKNQFVDAGKHFYYIFSVIDKDGLEIKTARRLLRATPQYDAKKKQQRFKINKVFLFKQGNVDFAVNYNKLLKSIYKQMQKYPGCSLLIEGHTDNRPIYTDTFTSNHRLSVARANKVAKLMIEKYSLNKDQIKVVGYADTLPVAPNDTDEGRAQNRRVEITISK